MGAENIAREGHKILLGSKEEIRKKILQEFPKRALEVKNIFDSIDPCYAMEITELNVPMPKPADLKDMDKMEPSGETSDRKQASYQQGASKRKSEGVEEARSKKTIIQGPQEESVMGAASDDELRLQKPISEGKPTTNTATSVKKETSVRPASKMAEQLSTATCFVMPTETSGKKIKWGVLKTAEVFAGTGILVWSYGGEISANTKIEKVQQIVREQLLRALADFEDAWFWTHLQLPPLRSKEDLSYSVVDTVINSMGSIFNDIYGQLKAMEFYYERRADLIDSVVINPQITDYRRAVNCLDHIEYQKCRHRLHMLQHYYLMAFDTVRRNLKQLTEHNDLPDSVYT